jgi:hypothetical protein
LYKQFAVTVAVSAMFSVVAITLTRRAVPADETARKARPLARSSGLQSGFDRSARYGAAAAVLARRTLSSATLGI